MRFKQSFSLLNFLSTLLKLWYLNIVTNQKKRFDQPQANPTYLICLENQKRNRLVKLPKELSYLPKYFVSLKVISLPTLILLFQWLYVFSYITLKGLNNCAKYFLIYEQGWQSCRTKPFFKSTYQLIEITKCNWD